MSQGHFDRLSNTNDTKRVRLNGFSSKNASYEKYKAGLHAIFDGKAPLPEHLRSSMVESEKESLAPNEKIKTKSKSNDRISRRLSSSLAPSYDIFIEAIKRSSTIDEITRTFNALFEAGHILPDDEDILSKGLSHRDENVVLQMLQKLEKLLTERPAKSPRLLKSRIENVALLASLPSIKNLCQSIRAVI